MNLHRDQKERDRKENVMCNPFVRTSAAIPYAVFLMMTSVVMTSAQTTPRYTGPGSCSSPSCHGSVQIRNSASVLQNEYSTWAVSDKHARSSTVLNNDISKRMGRILKVQPETSDKCLDCHKLNVAQSEQSRSFDMGDGVSCESCHGPASEWLGPHTTREWTHERSVKAGMIDARDPIRRAENCLSCHLGTEKKYVDHDMIAAGHPDLYFELDSFSAAMPKHWKEPEKDPWYELRLMTTGQAVQLRENMRRIARESAKAWPEFSELDCFACHHGLTATKDSWRQERGYEGRRPGSPAWNPSRYAVLKLILDQVDPPSAAKLQNAFDKVGPLVSDIRTDRQRIAASAEEAANVADAIANRLNTLSIDAPTALRVMNGIGAGADWISAQGERAAEQTAMVLNSLVVKYIENAKPDAAQQKQMTEGVSGLFRLLENPATYTPRRFADQLRQFARAGRVRELGNGAPQ
jgi:hypothetical protein